MERQCEREQTGRKLGIPYSAPIMGYQNRFQWRVSDAACDAQSNSVVMSTAPYLLCLRLVLKR